MSFVLADRVQETTSSLGTGTIDLGGAVSGYQAFVAGVGDGNETYYCISHQSQDEWEVGIGTVTDATPDTLSRDTVLASSNSGSAVDFSAGTKDVFCTHLADRTAYFDDSNKLVVAHSGGDKMLVSHDDTSCLFETAAGAFCFTADTDTFTNATVALDVKGVGTGTGKLRVYDQDYAEYAELYCAGGNVLFSAAGTSPGNLLMNYDGESDVYLFSGTTGNPDFRVYGYDSGDSAVKFFRLLVGSDGVGYIRTSTSRDIKLDPGSDVVIVDNVIKLVERSSDPSAPAEGECIIWMSDGIDKGDDGDVMIASTAGGVTKYGTLFDHSGGSAWS
jgi:hypothetical protein